MLLTLTQDRFKKLLSTSGTHLIFKHSSSCGVSRIAYEQITLWMQTYHQPIYLLEVHTAPELKIKVSEQLGIRHESPQLLLIKHGIVEAVANHRYITIYLLQSRFTLPSSTYETG